jgi:hypothetical protein
MLARSPAVMILALEVVERQQQTRETNHPAQNGKVPSYKVNQRNPSRGARMLALMRSHTLPKEALNSSEGCGRKPVVSEV